MKIQEMNYNEPNIRKKPKKKRKNTKRLFFWIKSILVLTLFVTTVVLLALSPLFNITKVEVKGNTHYKQEDIIGTSGIVMGSNGFKTIGSDLKNIITFRYGFAEKSILKAYPYVKSVIVRFIVPGKVRISITERKPEAIVPYMGTNLLIDDEAYVLETIGKQSGKGLPLVKGLKFASFEVGQGLKLQKPEAYADALKLIEQIKASDQKSQEKLYNLVNSIDVSDRGKIRLTYDSRLVINFGNLSDLGHKLEFCKKIVFENLAKEDKGLLDMTVEDPSFSPKD